MVQYGYVRRETCKRKAQRAHLTNGKMEGTTDELALVQHISRLPYVMHFDHLLVHFVGELNFKKRGVGVESSERVFMKLDQEWRRRILWYWLDKLCALYRLGRSLQPAGKRLHGSVRTNANNNKYTAYSETPCRLRERRKPGLCEEVEIVWT